MQFLNTDFLVSEEIKLVVDRLAEGNPARNWVPAYHFHICDLQGNIMVLSQKVMLFIPKQLQTLAPFATNMEIKSGFHGQNLKVRQDIIFIERKAVLRNIHI